MKIAKVLGEAGSIIGGAIGNGIETGVDGYETYEDYEHHNYGGMVQNGLETVVHGVETVTDALSGDWL
jgi:hypothetical protein